MQQIIWSMSPGDDIAIQAAKDWVRDNNYTRDDVDIKRDSKSVWVQFKPESTYE